MDVSVPFESALKFRCKFEGCDQALLYFVEQRSPIDKNELDRWLLNWCLENVDEDIEVVWIQKREPKITMSIERPFHLPAYEQIDIRIVETLEKLHETFEYMWIMEGHELSCSDEEDKENQETFSETVLNETVENFDTPLVIPTLYQVGLVDDQSASKEEIGVEESDDNVETANCKLGCLVVNLMDFETVGAFDVSEVLVSVHNLLRYISTIRRPSNDRARALVLLPYSHDVARVISRHDRNVADGDCEFDEF
ncbi:hypothetical protein M3Y94_00603900 [Aphelenchoides besseyi]|nr:hypothetical protein M3Y94_00603900 [Aphelenchoides besseyi]KAI6222248.1 hypothetical protein M3Y95_00964800 [Aphelenchoides besseyi]